MPTYNPTINLQDSFTGTESVVWSISDGPPNGTYDYEFVDVAGVYASATGSLNSVGAATITTELGRPEMPSTNFLLNVILYLSSGDNYTSLGDGIYYVDPSPPPPPAPVLTYSSTSTGSIIRMVHYNDIQTKVNEIIGLGQDGWGQGSQNSSAVTTRSRVSRTQWGNLINDVDFTKQHITGTTSSLVAPSTGTAISPNLGNALGSVVFDDLLPLRYTCHPSQFYGYPGETVNTFNGTSTRTTVWGREISQQVRVDWPTNLFARYFFNAGSVLTWRPIYTSIADPNDRDEEWAAFIDYMKANVDYEYARDDFLGASASKTTTYTSGTLSVTILALRNGTTSTATRVDLTAIFRNDDLSYISVDPVRGYWNYGPWETP